MKVAQRETGDRLLIKVRACPGASRDAVLGLHDDALKVAITAAPEKGKANQSIVKVLAKALELRKSQVEIHSGETSRDKWFAIAEITKAELTERLDKWAES